MLIDWFTVGAQALNFLILVWLMKRFLYKPVLNAIDAREKRIAAELSDAVGAGGAATVDCMLFDADGRAAAADLDSVLCVADYRAGGLLHLQQKTQHTAVEPRSGEADRKPLQQVERQTV